MPKIPLPEGLTLLGASHDGKSAVVASARPDETNRGLSLWDAASGKPVEECKGVALPLPDYVSVSADGRRMAYVDTETRETVKVYDWERKGYLSTLPIGTKYTGSDGHYYWDVLKNQASFSPDETLLAFCGMHDGYHALLLYDLDLGDSAGILYCRQISYSAWSGNGRWIITGSAGANGRPVVGSRCRGEAGRWGRRMAVSEVIAVPPAARPGRRAGDIRSAFSTVGPSDHGPDLSKRDVSGVIADAAAPQPGRTRATRLGPLRLARKYIALKPNAANLPEGSLLLASDTETWVLQPNDRHEDNEVFTLRKLKPPQRSIVFKHPGFTDRRWNNGKWQCPVPRLHNAEMSRDGTRLAMPFRPVLSSRNVFGGLLP